jgi:hypothetical protein
MATLAATALSLDRVSGPSAEHLSCSDKGLGNLSEKMVIRAEMPRECCLFEAPNEVTCKNTSAA